MTSNADNSNATVQDPQPFTIAISQERLSDLKSRLMKTRLPDELEDSGWNYGVPLSEIRRLIKYWREGYDWRIQEETLNLQPHFHTPITVDGPHGTLDIHFTH